MLGEIYVEKKRNLFVRKAAFCTEEAAIQRLPTRSLNDGQQVTLIRLFERTDFNFTPVA
jgi:hypothetical protein